MHGLTAAIKMMKICLFRGTPQKLESFQRGNSSLRPPCWAFPWTNIYHSTTGWSRAVSVL